MKKITCISYHNSGSGAVDDLLKEFKGIQPTPDGVECRFLQDPDGVSDLEFNLVDNWHRLNSGFAIKRFAMFSRFYNHTYSLVFGKNWKKYSEEYADSLTDFRYKGYWHGDIRLLPLYKRAIYKGRRGFSKIMPKKYRKTTDYNYFPNIDYIHSKPTREEFYEKTQTFVENLCNSIWDDKNEFLLLEQMISTGNVSRYLNYVSDLKIILVDRDPRDLYVLGTWGKTHVLSHDVEQFIKQYLDFRQTAAEERKNKNLLYVQFEDLIYKYDETVDRITEFLGLDKSKHIAKKTIFKPEVSIKNTQSWKRIDGFSEQLKILDKHLSAYYYDFPEEG